MTPPERVSAADARTLLLAGQGLLANPARRAGPAATLDVVRRLGFVQLDSIQRVARAQQLILGARIDGHRPAHLDTVAFGQRALFEHWTHDASLIPVEWYPHWQHRFERRRAKLPQSSWYRQRLGTDPEVILAHVLERITREGALPSIAFTREARASGSAKSASGGWWDWSPEKAALEFLWHSGRLAICGRDDFQKRYDLAERVFPVAHAMPMPDQSAHVDWACSEALDRLGVATPAELAAFFRAVDLAAVRAWCQAALRDGRVVAVETVDVSEGRARAAVAVPDWRERVRRAPTAPDRMRALAPFDPLVRDRARLLRLFGFDYRFEAFVPEASRVYGYYVLPLLDRDAVVGRIDPRFDRERGVLEINAIWWEPGVTETPQLLKRLEGALGVLAGQIGASTVELPSAQARRRARSASAASRSSAGRTSSAPRSGRVKTSSSKP
ncbi:MAG: hypothetical protein RL756_381 [Pseudomonadota bacterium]